MHVASRLSDRLGTARNSIGIDLGGVLFEKPVDHVGMERSAFLAGEDK